MSQSLQSSMQRSTHGHRNPYKEKSLLSSFVSQTTSITQSQSPPITAFAKIMSSQQHIKISQKSVGSPTIRKHSTCDLIGATCITPIIPTATFNTMSAPTTSNNPTPRHPNVIDPNRTVAVAPTLNIKKPSPLTLKIGAESTIAGNECAMILFNSCQTTYEFPTIEQIRAGAEVDFQETIANFSGWLLAQKKRNGHPYAVSTITEYVGKLKEALKDISPSHKVWLTENNWYNTYLFQIKRHAQRQKLREPEDDDANTDPIYRYYDQNRLGSMSTSPSLNDIVVHLLKSSTKFKYEERLLLVITFLAAGRGGEAKFLNYHEWMFDDYLQALTVMWKEPKTIRKYPMAFGCDFHLWQVDLFHALGSFWACEDGLFRTPSHPINGPPLAMGMKYFTFQRFRPDTKDDAWLARHVSTILAKFVDKCYNVSSKSLRKGAVTTMMVHPTLDGKFVTIRSGHVALDNSRFYYHGNSAGSLPGFKALGDWSNCHATAYVPRLTTVVNDVGSNVVSSFIENLFMSNLPHFQKDGKLYRLLEVCAASLLRYFHDVNGSLGFDNPLLQKMNNALLASNYQFKDDETPLIVLERWSRCVVNDFTMRNTPAAVGVCSSQPMLLSLLNDNVIEIKNSMARLPSLTAHHVNNSPQKRNADTTDCSPKRVKKVSREDVDVISKPSLAEPSVVNVTMVKPMTLEQAPDPSKMDLSISGIMEYFKRMQYFKSRMTDWEKFTHPSVKNESSKLVLALKIAKYCCADSTLQFLCNRVDCNDVNVRMELKKAVTAIESRVLYVLAILEAKFVTKPQDNKEEKKKSVKRKKSPTYTAIGARLAIVKTNMKETTISLDDEIKAVVSTMMD